MKGKLISNTLVLSSLFFAMNSFAGDGIVHFRGEVIDSTCEVTADTKDQYVEMGKVNRSTFTGVNSTAAPKAFSIKLEKCPATYTKAAVRFDGSEDANTSGLLAIGSAGAPGLTAPDISSDHTGDYTGASATPAAATGIAIGIYNQDHTPVKLYQSSAWTNIDTTSGAAEMKFIARYVQTLATVTPGTGNADSQFTVEYQK